MQEALISNEVRSWIGREDPPFTVQVTELEIKRFAVATDDLNPLYLDDEYASRSRYGGTVAPPLFYMADLTDPVPEAGLREDGGSVGRFPIPPVPLDRAVDGGTEIEFFAPIRPGDTLTVKSRITDIYQKEGRSGPLVFVVRETIYTNQKGEKVVAENASIILR